MATKKTKSRKARTKPRQRPGARRQPETLRLRDVTPSFTATDLQRSIAFYRDVLGFVIGEEWRDNGTLQGCEMRAGALDQEPMDMPWGERQFQITDPDGFKLTFIQTR